MQRVRSRSAPSFVRDQLAGPVAATDRAMKPLLAIIVIVAVAGLAFSGYLSYRELFAGAGQCTPLGDSGTIFGAPPCIYGFFMYLAIVVMAAFALFHRRATR
jgi:uncharacterized membrane protein